jgi:RES domain-containing protein
MRLYRFSSEEYAADLSGGGGFYFMGRWNEQGVACIYTSTHISLAILETLANKRWHKMPSLCLVTLELSDVAVLREILPETLPLGWKTEYPYHSSTLDAGTAFLRKGSEAGLSVPSSLVPQERNVILSPHRAAAAGLQVVSVELFVLDGRLVST